MAMSEPLDGMDAMVLDLGSCADLKPASKGAAVTAEGPPQPPPAQGLTCTQPQENCRSLNGPSVISPQI